MSNITDPLQSLIQYVMYTKPYATKLVDIGLDYTYGEPLKVSFAERLQMDVDWYLDDTKNPLAACPGGFDIDEFGSVVNTRKCVPTIAGDDWILVGGSEAAMYYQAGDVLELFNADGTFDRAVMLIDVQYNTSGRYKNGTTMTFEEAVPDLPAKYFLLETDTLFDWPMACTKPSKTTLSASFKEHLQMHFGLPPQKFAVVSSVSRLSQSIKLRGQISDMHRGMIVYLRNTTHNDNHHMWRVGSWTYDKISNETFIYVLPDPNGRKLRDAIGGELYTEEAQFTDLIDVSMSDPSRGYDSDPFDIESIGLDESNDAYNNDLMLSYVEKYTDTDGQIKTRFQESISFTFDKD